MVIKHILPLLGLITLSLAVQGQQDPQFSMNMYNKLYPNPGYAGTNKAICGTLIRREQWVGFPGRPTTTMLSVHSPIKMIRGGAGLTIWQDQLGAEKSVGVKGTYAYHQAMRSGLDILSVGIAAGFLNKNFNATEFVANDPIANDPNIPNSNIGDAAFDLDFGVYYKSQYWYAGLSATHLPQSTLTDTDLNFKVARHYYLMGGYDWAINKNPMHRILPSILGKFDGATPQLDVNVQYEYNHKFWGGFSYRIEDALAFMAGYKGQIKDGDQGDFMIGYAYDLTTSLLSKRNLGTGGSQGTHEIVLRYCFNILDDPPIQRHKTVRFL